jgi:hypothetical protein
VLIAIRCFVPKGRSDVDVSSRRLMVTAIALGRREAVGLRLLAAAGVVVFGGALIGIYR